MGSIVIQLQEQALDSKVPLPDLLRKAIVVAKKLSISEFETWIEAELNGYTEPAEFPEYRWITGEVKFWNPYHGWCPVIFEDGEDGAACSRRPTAQSVAELEHLAQNSEGSQAHLPFPHSMQAKFAKMGAPNPPVLLVPVAAIPGILDAVRNIVLNWAIKLEQDGILGEGLSFTKAEQDAASGTPYHINNFFGSVSNSQIQQHSPNATQVATSGLDVEQVKAFLDALSQAVSDLHLEGDDQAEVEAEVATVESQMASPRPKWGILRESLGSIRRVLEGAGGGAAAKVLLDLLAGLGV
jgi:hypothetical protein